MIKKYVRVLGGVLGGMPSDTSNEDATIYIIFFCLHGTSFYVRITT